MTLRVVFFNITVLTHVELTQVICRRIAGNYGASKLSWQLKNMNNSAILQVIIMGLALIDCAREAACHTENWSQQGTEIY